MSLIEPELLKILCCPETHQPLTEADAKTVADLNSRIAAGSLKSRAGKAVSAPLDGALIRQDRQVAYAVRGRIPMMLVEDAIPLAAS